MKHNYSETREIKIDLVDILWKLLMQWKSILIICIAMALLTTCAKFLKDNKVYKTALAENKKAEEMATKPAEDRIEEALDLLPSSQRDDVLFVVQQQEMVDSQKEYLNESILLNTDPVNQRQLAIKYILDSESGVDMRALSDAYSTCLRRHEYLEKLRDAISPDTNLEYIDEIIDTKNKDILAGDATNAVYTVTITLPDNTDADSIVSIFDSAVNDLHGELNVSVGEHSIAKINVEDHSVVNEDAIDRKTNMTYTIDNLSNSIENDKGKLNAEQQTAVETLIAINQATDTYDNSLMERDATSFDLQKPSFSKKHALLGFLLGAFLYACIFVVILILKKTVASPSIAQSYTNTRLLGEVYKSAHHKGFSRLFVSDTVAKLRYRYKLDVDKQISAFATTTDAVCAHHGTDKLTLMLSGIDNEFGDIVDRIVKACTSVGNKKSIDLIYADELDERILGSVNSVIYIISSNTKVEGLVRLLSLCDDYDVRSLGSIYLEEL